MPRKNPWIGEQDVGFMDDWLDKYSKFSSQWFTSQDRELIESFHHDIGEAVQTQHSAGTRRGYAGSDVSSARLRKVLSALRRGYKEGKRRTREYNAQGNKEALEYLKEYLIDELDFTLKQKNPGEMAANIPASKRHALPDTDFAVPENEGLPINTPGRTRAAMARFNQYKFDSVAQSKRAFDRIKRRAKRFGIDASNFISEFRSNPELKLERDMGGWFVSAPGAEYVAGLPSGPFKTKEDARATGEMRLRGAQGHVDDLLQRRNPESADSEFQEGVAKALWINLYSSEVEEQGLEDELGPGAGGDWEDVMPEVPPAVYEDAKEFSRQVAKANKAPINVLIALAASADEVDLDEIDEEDFGYYLTMSALGHGISWFDDHGDFDITLPHWENDADSHNAVYEIIEEAK